MAGRWLPDEAFLGGVSREEGSASFGSGGSGSSGLSDYEARRSRASSGDRRPQGRALVLVGAQAEIGASIWQTPGGIQAELDRINAEFMIFGHEISEVVTNLPGFPTAVDSSMRPLVDLFGNVWSPLVQEWQKFYADNHGWLGNFFWNHAPEAEQYLRQLEDVRGKAAQLGMRVLSPAPTRPAPSLLFDPERNVVDDAAQGARTAMGDLWGVVKIALIVGLGLAGVFLVIAASGRARSLRS